MPRAHVRLPALIGALVLCAPAWGATVVVATRDLRIGHPLTSDDVAEVQLADTSVPPEAIRSLKDVVGRIPTAPFYAGDFLRPERMAQTSTTEGVESLIPFTHVRADLAARPVTDLYRVGQHVDILWSRPTVACALLQDVPIVGIQNTAGKIRTTAGSVAAGLVFAVTPAQAYVLDYASKEGQLSYAVREPGDVEIHEDEVCPKADARAVIDPLLLPIGQSIVLELDGIVPTGISVANETVVSKYSMGEPGWVHLVGKSPGVTTLSVDLRPNGPHLVYDLRVYDELSDSYSIDDHPADWFVVRDDEAVLASFGVEPAYIRAASDAVRVEDLHHGNFLIVGRHPGRTDLLVRLPGKDESTLYGIDVVMEPHEVPKLWLAPGAKLPVPADRPVVAAATLDKGIATVKAKGTKITLKGLAEGKTRLAVFFEGDPTGSIFDVDVDPAAPRRVSGRARTTYALPAGAGWAQTWGDAWPR